MLVVTAYPIAYAVWLSLQRYDLRFPDDREFIGLANYASVLSASQWWDSVLSTVIITVFSVIIELVLGFTLAWVMHLSLIHICAAWSLRNRPASGCRRSATRP